MFKATDLIPEDPEARRDYFDRHTPHVLCDEKAIRGEKFRVKIKMGDNYKHPDDEEHYIKFLQLWNMENFIAEIQFAQGSQGGRPSHWEVDFYLYPDEPMRLVVMAACSKHGLWHSREVVVQVVDN